MLKIAICDDEKIFAEKIKELLEVYLDSKHIAREINIYTSGIDFVALGENVMEYDIAFLDIDMKDMNGIQTADKIRVYSQDIYIAFVTAYINYAPEGYRCNAIRYILKNSNQLAASIYECMDAVLYNMNYRGIDKRVFICNHKEKEVIINKVMYIESSAHKVMFHIDGKESDDYVTNNKLNDIEKTLKDCEYMIRVHQGYMVNMMYVKKVSGYRIYLKNGEEIGVPKPRYKEVKKTIMEFKAII